MSTSAKNKQNKTAAAKSAAAPKKDNATKKGAGKKNTTPAAEVAEETAAPVTTPEAPVTPAATETAQDDQNAAIQARLNDGEDTEGQSETPAADDKAEGSDKTEGAEDKKDGATNPVANVQSTTTAKAKKETAYPSWADPKVGLVEIQKLMDEKRLVRITGGLLLTGKVAAVKLRKAGKDRMAYEFEIGRTKKDIPVTQSYWTDVLWRYVAVLPEAPADTTPQTEEQPVQTETEVPA